MTISRDASPADVVLARAARMQRGPVRTAARRIGAMLAECGEWDGMSGRVGRNLRRLRLALARRLRPSLSTVRLWYLHEVSPLETQLRDDPRLAPSFALTHAVWAGSEVSAALAMLPAAERDRIARSLYGRVLDPGFAGELRERSASLRRLGRSSRERIGMPSASRAGYASRESACPFVDR